VAAGSDAGARWSWLLWALGVAWSVFFAWTFAADRLNLYGDGGYFTYALIVGEPWSALWRDFPGRLFAYVYAYLPAQAVMVLTGSAAAAELTYAGLFGAAPLLALSLTAALDRTHGRIVLSCAAASHVALLPLIFGFPTEVWFAHGLLWCALAAVLRARPWRV
jgi:hypothetical protein